MSRIVCKFGGTSLADAAQLRRVKSILRADPRRRIIVPSAPGRRTKDEAKITDLLYLCHEMASLRADFSGPFGTIRSRFLEIEQELGLKTPLAEQLDRFQQELAAGCTADYAASRGEAFNGLLLAAFLDATLVNPEECVVLTSEGRVDPRTYALVQQKMNEEGRSFVLPGFYGRGPDGTVKTFSRGGSDISGAIAARAVDASLYENWTDVSGLLMADPRIVENPSPMAEVTYREIRELSYMGANVLHDEAILPVREVGIPISIKNTNAPDHRGTRIVPRLSAEEVQNTEIAGIAGKQGFCMFAVDKSLMNKEVGFIYRLLGLFERRQISVEHCPSSIDSVNVIAESRHVGSAAEELVDDIQRVLQPDHVKLEPELALVAIVGEGMIHSIGTAARVFNALSGAGVNVRVINQGASELNIIVGVHPQDYEKAVRALYDAFVQSHAQRGSKAP